MMYPLVTDLAADGVPVAVTCRVLGNSQARLIRVEGQSVDGPDLADAHLVNAARDIHADGPAFGRSGPVVGLHRLVLAVIRKTVSSTVVHSCKGSAQAIRCM